MPKITLAPALSLPTREGGGSEAKLCSVMVHQKIIERETGGVGVRLRGGVEGGLLTLPTGLE